jgi:uncharacterized protein YjbJ (UPF0337 family)
MDKNRIIGSGKQIRGSIKVGIGKILGNDRMQVDGKVDQAEGKAQKTLGKIKDKMKS